MGRLARLNRAQAAAARSRPPAYLSQQQIEQLDQAHEENARALLSGQATEEQLWHWVGGVLTWSRAAQLMELGEAEMDPQLELLTAVLNRWSETGCIQILPAEHQVVLDGVVIQSLLAKATTQAAAALAADWSEAETNRLASELRSH